LELYVQTYMKNEIGEIWFLCEQLDDSGRTKISIWATSNMSFADSKSRWKQHSRLLFATRQILNALNIEYVNPKQQIYGFVECKTVP